MLSNILAFALLAVAAVAQSPAYGQCGGNGWKGATSCVSGYTCTVSNAYYSQCLPGSSGGKPTTTAKTTSTKAAAPTSAPPSGPSTGNGKSYKASFTQYGSGDQNGSGNCNVRSTACGFYTSPGYSAAVSQNEFGVGPGAGAGPGCGTCWKLTLQTDSSGRQVQYGYGSSIVVMVTNLCPANGNPLCSQNGMGGTNSYGANLNFDLCIDSRANGALFGQNNIGLGVGSAVQVDCSQWNGNIVH